MAKVAVYVRVSTEEEQTFERQITELEALIFQHGYKKEDIDIYADKISGFTKNRPELDKMLDNINTEPTIYNMIYVTEITRLGRNPRHTRAIVDDLADKGIPIYIKQYSIATLDPNGQRNMTANIMLQIIMEVANDEAKTIKQRFISGKIHNVIVEGRSKGYNEAYGYMADTNKKLVVNPDESPVVEQIFMLYKQGQGMRNIAQILNNSNIPTRFASTKKDRVITYKKSNTSRSGAEVKWDSNNIHNILTNTIYKGIRVYMNQTTSIERIVSDDLFDECTNIRLNKSHRNYLTKNTYLLKDIIYCGCCGSKYMGTYDTSKNGNKTYRCYTRVKSMSKCTNGAININLLESTLYNLILTSGDFLKQLDNPDDLLNQIKSDLKMHELNLSTELRNLESKKNEEERLLKGYISGVIALERYTQIQLEITNELDTIKNKIDILNNEIRLKKQTIESYDKESASAEMIINAKENRPELKSIFNQFISKVIFNTISKKRALASVYVKINNLPYHIPLKIIFDTSGQRGERINKYFVTNHLLNEPVYKDNILISSLTNSNPVDKVYITDTMLLDDGTSIDLGGEYVQDPQSLEEEIRYINEWVIVPKENNLKIENSIN